MKVISKVSLDILSLRDFFHFDAISSRCHGQLDISYLTLFISQMRLLLNFMSVVVQLQ